MFDDGRYGQVGLADDPIEGVLFHRTRGGRVFGSVKYDAGVAIAYVVANHVGFEGEGDFGNSFWEVVD